MATQLPLFVCPSDNGPMYTAYNSMNDGTPYYAISKNSPLFGNRANYDFSTSPVFEMFYVNGWKSWSQYGGTPWRAMFGTNSNCKIRDVLDGTSFTMAVGETTRAVANGNGNSWSYRGWMMVGVSMYDGIWNYPSGVNQWMCMGSGWCGGFNPNSYQYGRLASWGMCGSLHPTGLLILMADGSTHFINELTDNVTLTRLGCMSDHYTFDQSNLQ